MTDGAHQERPIRLFYSYSHRDEELRNKLEDHLAALRRSGMIAEWHDRNIDVGDEWSEEIDRNLSSADIILLLVSASFIASDYCWSVEVKKALERHDKGEVKVIPVVLRPCSWHRTPFAKLQAAPTDAKPVVSWSDPDAALYDVTGKIERAVIDLQRRRRAAKQRQQAAEEAQERAETKARRAAEAARAKPTEGLQTSSSTSIFHQKRWVVLFGAVVVVVAAGVAILQELGVVVFGTLGKPDQPEVRTKPTPPATQDTPPDFTVFRDAPFAPEMVVLPAGEFLMGSANGDSEAYNDEKPQHRVQIRYRLAVSRSPVTFDEWDAYVAEGGTNYRPNDQGWGRGRRPVINTSWNDTKQYVAWLSRKTGQTYHLLSEAGWEYAARAGTTTKRWWGNDITPQIANYGGKIAKTTQVGSYPESPFKLYDMLGNVWEWVEDCWNENYVGAPGNGEPWVTGDCGRRVLRGGSWNDSPRRVRSASRNGGSADNRINDVGFRVARAF